MRLNGWRGAGLLIIGAASLFRGWQYAVVAPSHLPPGIAQLAWSGSAVRWLGILWFAASAAGILCAFRLRDRWGIGALAFMHALWASALVAGWALTGRGWLAAVASAGVAGLIVCWSRMVNPPRVPDEALRRVLDDGPARE